MAQNDNFSGQEANAPDPTAARAGAELDRLVKDELPAGLYLVSTPIGNLADITLRALGVLARADVIYCEDTRHSRTLTSHYAIRVPLRPYHEHNAASERPRVLAELDAGKRVALISDAGTPLVSDPGFKLVREALEAGHRVESVPGVSAVLAALTVAGLPTDSFFFGGFLPHRQAARRSRLAELAAVPSTLVFFEAPSRLAEALADLADVYGTRPAAVARELTKLHEEIRRGSLPELAASIDAGKVKGEIVMLVGPPGAREITDEVIVARLREMLASTTLRDASKAVAAELSVARARVYELGLQLRRSGMVSEAGD